MTNPPRLDPGVPFTMRLPEHLRRYLIIRATTDGVSAAEVVRRALEVQLDRERIYPDAELPPEVAEEEAQPLRSFLMAFDREHLDQAAERLVRDPD